MEMNKEDEINQVNVGAPHLVILGAGASYAALPVGDKNGRRLPLMDNLIETLDIKGLIESSGMDFSSNNFEIIYDQLFNNNEAKNIREELERIVYGYFAEMELPDTPTIYDHLLLSLRGKDVVATFNWDPLLIQAYKRNGRRYELPKLLFLHGNVAVGHCPDGHIMGNNGEVCGQCGKRLVPTRLLYPIGNKDYNLDEFISRQWITFQHVLEKAFMITIFGYGAPVSDAGAIKLMKSAWSGKRKRELEETEIIDIKSEEELIKTWKPFIFSHHYRIKKTFYDSWIAKHPRRTGEAYLNQFIEAKFIEDNPLPKDAGFDALWQWFDVLQAVEKTKRVDPC